MDDWNIRRSFALFAGSEKHDRFMHQLHHNPKCRKGLLYWQEQLLDAFRAKEGIGAMEHAALLQLFHYCHRHDEELVAGHPEDAGSGIGGEAKATSHFYREAYRRVEEVWFPFAAHFAIDLESAGTGAPWHCPRCREARATYLAGTHRETLFLADYDKCVCDIERELLEIFDELGEESEVGRLEALALHFHRRRVVGSASDPTLDAMAGKLVATGRALLAGADLLLDEPAFRDLRDWLEGDAKEIVDGIDAAKSLEELKTLFDRTAGDKRDAAVRNECRWLWIVVSELRREIEATGAGPV